MYKFIDLLLPWWWGKSETITDSFITVILVSFVILLAILFWKTARRRRLIDSLSYEVGKYTRPAQPSIKHELKEKFSRNDEFAEAWQEFEDSLLTRENQDLVYKTDDASLFFGEDRLLDQHLNLRFWNSVPALLVGFGILGTFVGLVWGLIPFADINFPTEETPVSPEETRRQINAIQRAIEELLSGVSTAFVTSVWGMFASLLFNGLEKWRIGRLSRAIANLQRALDRLFALKTEEEIAFQQHDELEQQTAALKSFSTDLANEITGAMAQGRQEIIQELHNAPEAFSSAMVEQLAPSLDNLNTAVEELRQHKEESSTDAIQRLVEEFRESLSGSTTAELEGLAETVRNASESLAALPDQLTSMMSDVQEQIDRSRQLLADTSQDQSGQMKSMMDEMLKTFQNTIDAHQSRLSATTNSANEEITQIAADVRDLLASAANQANEQLARRMADFEAVSAQSIQSLEATIAELQQSLTSTASQTAEESQGMVTRMLDLLESAANRAGEQLNRRMENMETVSNQSIQTLQMAITELQQSLTSTLDDQQQIIRRVSSQTEAASVESTDRIRQLVEQSAGRLEEILLAGEQSVKTLLSQQAEQISAINAQIANSQGILAKGREMLEQVDTSVASIRQMIETTQALSSQLMLGADRLETAGQRLTQASSAFNQQNENYLAANRETIEQLQSTLIQSRELLNNFAQRFQTIDSGLQDIFSEIQRGLTEYATTSRSSINEYLSTFSTQLTNAANALAGSVEALGDNVEVLNDMIEGFRRR